MSKPSRKHVEKEIEAKIVSAISGEFDRDAVILALSKVLCLRLAEYHGSEMEATNAAYELMAETLALVFIEAEIRSYTN